MDGTSLAGATVLAGASVVGAGAVVLEGAMVLEGAIVLDGAIVLEGATVLEVAGGVGSLPHAATSMVKATAAGRASASFNVIVGIPLLYLEADASDGFVAIPCRRREQRPIGLAKFTNSTHRVTDQPWREQTWQVGGHSGLVP